MTGKIPDSFIDDLLARTDIVSVIESHIALKKAGREFVACCPFHNEKTPSFTVSPDKQFYHCFGCGAHGSAIGFLMEYEQLGFVEAVTDLATRAGLSIPTVELSSNRARTQDDAQRQQIFQALDHANQYYRQQLKKHPKRSDAVDYLKGRGITGEIAAKFGIGFAPPGWTNLLSQLGSDSARTNLLDKSGLISRRDNQTHYDKFRDRITFPIRDTRGRVVGFGARSLSDENKPKYLNSPETAVFHKGQTLYGLFEARQTARSLERIVVVEGYMDVIALAQFGIDYAVATLGTATTPEQLALLFRFTSEVVFCFDGDSAGKRAAKKAMTTCLPQIREGREIKFMFLPEKEDPDTYVRKHGPEQFVANTTQATPLSDFLLTETLAIADTRSLEGRAKIVAQANSSLATIPQGLFKNMLVQRFAQTLQLTDHETENLYDPQSNAGALESNSSPASFRRSQRKTPTLIQGAISLLFQRPELAQLTPPEELQQIELPGSEILEKLVEILRKNPNLPLGRVIERFRNDTDIQYLAELVATANAAAPSEHIETEYLDTFARIKESQQQTELNRLLERSKRTPLSDHEKQHLKNLLAKRGS